MLSFIFSANNGCPEKLHGPTKFFVLYLL